MKYLKLYEEFQYEEEIVEMENEETLLPEEDVYQDDRGVYRIRIYKNY